MISLVDENMFINLAGRRVHRKRKHTPGFREGWCPGGIGFKLGPFLARKKTI